MKWICDACEQHDVREGKPDVSSPCILDLEVDDSVRPDCCPFSDCGVYDECNWKLYDETTCHKKEPVDNMHMIAEICDCEKMRKLMEPKQSCKLNRLAIDGIIENCPYCGKINPAYALRKYHPKQFEVMHEKAVFQPVKFVKVDNDPVKQPNHYCKGGYELGPILYAWGLSHRRASAVEYIMRAGDKDASKEVEDLRKAIRNIEMEIEYMEKYGKVRQ